LNGALFQACTDEIFADRGKQRRKLAKEKKESEVIDPNYAKGKKSQGSWTDTILRLAVFGGLAIGVYATIGQGSFRFNTM
jgi:hypothetical protein